MRRQADPLLLVALAYITFAGIHHFGWVDGVAIAATVYALMPWNPT